MNTSLPSILIVDDTPTNLKLLVDAFNERGFQISVAKNGESAIAKAKTLRPDIILLDVMMEGIDGFETHRQLKTHTETQTIPVIFMTALSDEANKLKAFDLGAVDYITKPIQVQEAIARVKTHIQLKNSQQKLISEIEEHQETEIQLRQTLKQLQETQIQLIQQEKMSSLGQLVAGVAHEINNPINFIYGNLNHANSYINDLIKLLQLYQKHCPDPHPDLQIQATALDFEFLVDDLPKMLASMKVGAERIQKIVLSLRNFSRMDEAEAKTVDIHEGIDSALMILQSRLKAKSNRAAIQVIKEYDALPLVECFPGLLNQAFMNLLINAIDAINEQKAATFTSSRPPIITISTKLLPSNQITVQITDNGIGIPSDIQPKVFDPFFTTKPIGEGTGLGLSISYEIIVKRHNGELQCSSDSHNGTSFAVTIPRKLQDVL